MISAPDRLAELVKLMEAGPVTQEDVDRLATLQALDMARLGRAYVEDSIINQEKLRELLE